MVPTHAETGRSSDRGRRPSQRRIADGQCQDRNVGRREEGLCLLAERRSGAVDCQESKEARVKSKLTGPQLLAMALVLTVGAAAQAPSTAPAKPSGLSTNEATAPAGGGANPDTKRVRPRDTTPHGPTPRLADGHPDLSGVWNGGGPVGDLAQGLAPGETIPLLPAAKALMDKRQSKDDPEANCLPTGIPRIAPYPWRIVQTPTHVFFLFEGNIHSFRQIIMNGKHPDDPDPTWYGNSIGTWDGDTLVVDTIGFNDKFWFDFRGHPHTDHLT